MRAPLIALAFAVSVAACGQGGQASAAGPTKGVFRGPVLKAQRYTPVSWQRDALAVAQRVWHPACGQLSLRFALPPARVSTAELWTGWAYAGDCMINVRANVHWLGYPDFCQVVLHEAGHVAGRQHTDTGIMRADATIERNAGRENGRRVVHWTGVDRRCLRRGDDQPARRVREAG